MRTNIRSLILAALFSALTIVGAFLRIQVGPLVVTLQFFFAALAGIVLGARWGALSQVTYLILGLVGVPVFSQGGGIGYLLQPTFGFLLGLAPTAWVIGSLHRRVAPLVACLGGLTALYATGLPYFYLIFCVHLGQKLALIDILCIVLVFLPGDLLKILALMMLFPTVYRAMCRVGAQV